MNNHEFLREDQDASLPVKPQAAGVRRVNNMPLLMVGGVLVVFVILVAWVAFDRSQRVKKQAAEPTTASATVDAGLADSILKASGNRAGGLVDSDASNTPSLPIAQVSNLDLPPPPPPGTAGPAKEDPIATQLKAAKLAMFQKAMLANTKVDGAVDKSAGGQAQMVATQARQARSNASAGGRASQQSAPMSGNDPSLTGGADMSGEDASLSSPKTSAYAAFDRANSNTDRWRLDSSNEAPRTPYELRAGFVIPATLISGVNSDLPGQIIGQVSQDVYDTATGKQKLIPQGTRLVGSYNSQAAYGQSRVLIAWQRLVFPDGKAMDIGSMPGADSAGYSGFNDKVNNHYLRLFGSALLMSGIVAGVNSSQTNPTNDPFGTSINTQLTQAIAQQMGQVAVEMFKKNLNIAPTLEIRPGYRFNVMVVKDLTFDKPYQAFDY